MKKLGSGFINGIYLFLLVGGYFLLMEALGLSDNIYLRFFNIVFVIVLVNRTVKQRVKANEGNFLTNFGAAILTGFVGVLLSIIGLTLYIIFITGIDNIADLAPSVMTTNSEVSLAQYCFALFAEGLSSSLIVAFTVMQYWKNSEVTQENTSA